MLELEVKVININLSSGHQLLEQCRPMYEYSWLIQRIKDYLAKEWSRDEAIVQALKDNREKGMLVEFVQKYGSEAINMLYTQFNLEDAKEVWQEEAYEEGRDAGRAEGECKTLIVQACKKKAKGLSLQETAAQLESDEVEIRRIYEAIEALGGTEDVNAIYEKYVRSRK